MFFSPSCGFCFVCFVLGFVVWFFFFGFALWFLGVAYVVFAFSSVDYAHDITMTTSYYSHVKIPPRCQLCINY